MTASQFSRISSTLDQSVNDYQPLVGYSLHPYRQLPPTASTLALNHATHVDQRHEAFTDSHQSDAPWPSN